MNKKTEMITNKRRTDMSAIKELPTVEEAGVIAVEISENLHDKLEAREQAFFIAGFQEAIKYLYLMDKE